jgi:hypothetical protein
MNRINMKVNERVEKGDLSALSFSGDREINGAYISDMAGDIIGIGEGSLLVALPPHKNPSAAVSFVDEAAVVFSRVKTPTEDAIARAGKAGKRLRGLDGDTWTPVNKLYELSIR